MPGRLNLKIASLLAAAVFAVSFRVAAGADRGDEAAGSRGPLTSAIGAAIARDSESAAAPASLPGLSGVPALPALHGVRRRVRHAHRTVRVQTPAPAAARPVATATPAPKAAPRPTRAAPAAPVAPRPKPRPRPQPVKPAPAPHVGDPFDSSG